MMVPSCEQLNTIEFQPAGGKERRKEIGEEKEGGEGGRREGEGRGGGGRERTIIILVAKGAMKDRQLL